MDKSELQTKLLTWFEAKFGYRPDPRKPETYSEKMLWRKLFQRDPEFVMLTDKFWSKDFVKDKGVNVIKNVWYGQDYTPRKYPFIAKPNHWSGQTKLIQDKHDWLRFKVIWEDIRNKKYGINKGEWAYWKIEPLLMIEPVLPAAHEVKCFCFNGVCEMIRYMPPRSNFNSHPPERLGESYFLPDGTYLDVHTAQNKPSVKEVDIDLRQAAWMAESLSKDIDHVRVDFYYSDQAWYFGEFTLYNGSGMVQWDPKEVDKWLGSFWKINHNK